MKYANRTTTAGRLPAQNKRIIRTPFYLQRTTLPSMLCQVVDRQLTNIQGDTAGNKVVSIYDSLGTNVSGSV